MSRSLIFLGSYRGWDLHLDGDDEFFADRGDGRPVLRSPVMADLKGMIDTCEEAQRWLRVDVATGEYEVIGGARPAATTTRVVLPFADKPKLDALNAGVNEAARAEMHAREAYNEAASRRRLARQRRRAILTTGSWNL